MARVGWVQILFPPLPTYTMAARFLRGFGSPPQGGKNMSWLVLLAIALVVLWILAQVFGFVLGAASNLLWIAALVLLAIWLFQTVAA